LADAARFHRHSPGDRWFVDETHVKVNAVWRYVYRAVDQHGQVIDVLLSARRDAKAARQFFTRALRILLKAHVARGYRMAPSHMTSSRSKRSPPLRRRHRGHRNRVPCLTNPTSAGEDQG
jgi:transposase-like protein